MKLKFLLYLPNGDELNTIVEKDDFSADIFGKLFFYLAKDFQVHGLDCILKSIRIVDTDEVLFEGTLAFSKYIWSCQPAAFFYEDQFLFKLDGPLFFPRVGWSSKVTILENPPYWELLDSAVYLKGGELEISRNFILNAILQRLGFFVQNALNVGPVLNGVRYSLNPEVAFEFIDQWSSHEYIALCNFLQIFQTAIEESIREIKMCPNIDDLYTGFLVGPSQLKVILSKFSIQLNYLHSQKNQSEIENISNSEKVWCIVQNSNVIEITHIDPEQRYHPSVEVISVEAPTAYFVKQGWEVREKNMICRNLSKLKNEAFQFLSLRRNSQLGDLPSALGNVLNYISFLQGEGLSVAKKLKIAVNQNEVFSLIHR